MSERKRVEEERRREMRARAAEEQSVKPRKAKPPAINTALRDALLDAGLNRKNERT